LSRRQSCRRQCSLRGSGWRWDGRTRRCRCLSRSWKGRSRIRGHRCVIVLAVSHKGIASCVSGPQHNRARCGGEAATVARRGDRIGTRQQGTADKFTAGSGCCASARAERNQHASNTGATGSAYLARNCSQQPRRGSKWCQCRGHGRRNGGDIGRAARRRGGLLWWYAGARRHTGTGGSSSRHGREWCFIECCHDRRRRVGRSRRWGKRARRGWHRRVSGGPRSRRGCDNRPCSLPTASRRARGGNDYHDKFGTCGWICRLPGTWYGPGRWVEQAHARQTFDSRLQVRRLRQDNRKGPGPIYIVSFEPSTIIQVGIKARHTVQSSFTDRKDHQSHACHEQRPADEPTQQGNRIQPSHR
jgi:hypothetical protein